MIAKIQDAVAAVVIGSTDSVARKVEAPDKLAAAAPVANGSAAAKNQTADAVSAAAKDEAAQQQNEREAEEKMNESQVSRMTQELNELMGNINCDLEFKYNKEVDIMSVKMINKTTKETIREYPPEDLIKGMIKAKEWLGAFLDRNA